MPRVHDVYSGYLFFQLNQTSTEIFVAIFRACIYLVILILQKAVHNQSFLLRQAYALAFRSSCISNMPVGIEFYF